MENSIPQLLQLLQDDDGDVQAAGTDLFVKLTECSEFRAILMPIVAKVHFKPNCMLRSRTSFRSFFSCSTTTTRVSKVPVQVYWRNWPTTVSSEQFLNSVADGIQVELRSAIKNAIPQFRLLLQDNDQHLRVLGAYIIVNLAEYSEFP